jgi:hypothetical protein
MFQIATPIWNEIAKTQELRTSFAKRFFPLQDEDMSAAIEAEIEKLKKFGASNNVALSYMVMAPLLWENEAIAAFVREHPVYYEALPNIVSVEEAVAIISRDYTLSSSEKEDLTELLRMKHGYGENNKLVTREQAALAIAILRRKLSGQKRKL